MSSINSIRDKQQLLKALASGERIKYIFFWGHRPAADGSITKTCFSQWFHAPFITDSGYFPTAEHFMMVKKAELFEDQETKQQILQARDPGKAKALGRKVVNFQESIWIELRWQIVVEANIHKFSQNPKLLKFLLGTTGRVLVEASPVDKIWGIGLDVKAAQAEPPAAWPGDNLLGFALMEVRERLAKQ